MAVFNRTVTKSEEFLAGAAKEFPAIRMAKALPELVGMLVRPRRLLLMVKAGAAVDEQIAALLPLLEPGDILIDGGNSNYGDTERRILELTHKGILYVGSGVSGGEEGALLGPSMMPGGNADAWVHLKPVFEACAAKADDGSPCCTWIGSGGSGHFVKMVHNGIEYGDMQIICEAYDILKRVKGNTNAQLADIFSRVSDCINPHGCENDEAGNRIITLVVVIV